MSPVLNGGDLDKVKEQARLLDDRSELDAANSGYVKLLSANHAPNDVLDIWSKPHPSGVHEYLVLGRAPVRARVMYDVLMDEAYHTEWDSHCAELRRLDNYPVLPSSGITHALNYWVVKYPSPLRKRDYVYERLAEKPHPDHEHDVKGSMYYFATRTVESNQMPEASRIVRVTDFQGCYCLRDSTVDELKPICEFLYIALGTPSQSTAPPWSTRVCRPNSTMRANFLSRALTLFLPLSLSHPLLPCTSIATDDPKGFLPKPIVNYFTSRGIPAAMQALYKACREYKSGTL
jgi:START domain